MFILVRTPSVLLLLVWPLSLSLATTREISVDFSSSWYLDVSVPKVPLINLCIQYMIYGSSPYVFPHSEICGSRLICSSPQLIAACHVFLRLLMPRHSPCALVCLNFFCFGTSFNIPRSLRSLFKNCWVTFNSFWFLYFSPSFHNYLCFDFSKIVFVTLNFKLYLERPNWFQFMSSSLLTIHSLE